MTDIAQVDYLFGTFMVIDEESNRPKTQIIAYPVVRRTAKRTHYVRLRIGDTVHLGSVDRVALERDGRVVNARRRYGDPEYVLYAAPPEVRTGQVDTSALTAELSRLRAEMAAAHPDRGGTAAEFIAAHQRFTAARERFSGLFDAEPVGGAW